MPVAATSMIFFDDLSDLVVTIHQAKQSQRAGEGRV
jgi:hypothetical protein